MKKILLSIFALSTLVVTAQNNVSTTPENKNAVLEEFTGIYCGYCPDGHKLAQQFHDANPSDVVLINVHAGSYADPNGGDPDFRTAFGAALASQSGVCGYPAGTINRIDFTSYGWNQTGQNCTASTAMSRGEFDDAGNIVLTQSSPVNMWGNAVIDLGTNTLTVDVEVYYTGNQTVNSNKLNVAVLQNNVEGPQSGMSANPTSILPNGNYNHQHMLRHLMTGQWGETISTISQGTAYTNQFVWNIPADINGVAVDPTNLEVAIFMSEDQEKVLTGEMTGMTVIFPNTDDAKFATSLASNLTCTDDSETDLTVTFQNYGSVALTSLDIEYSINGGASNTHQWTGNLASAGFETVNIPNVSLVGNSTNTINFALTNPNGVPDQNATNNTQSTTFNGLSSATNGQASIDITTDNYGSEITWNLKNGAGITIASGGPYADGSAVQQPTVTATLESGNCYTFTMLDSYGDGILSNGNYTVKDATGNVLASLSTFTSEQVSHFKTDDATYINEKISNFVVYPNPVKEMLTIKGIYTSVNIYDIFNKLILTSKSQKEIDVSSLSNGVYFVNIKTKNAITVKKITIAK